MSDNSQYVLMTKTKVIFTVNDCDVNRETVFQSKDFKIGSNIWQIIVNTNKMDEYNSEPMFVIEMKLKSKRKLFVRFDSFIYKPKTNERLHSFKEFNHISHNLSAIIGRMTTQEFVAIKETIFLNQRLIIGVIITVESKDVNQCIEYSISYRNTFNVKEFNDLHIICGDKEFFVCKAVLISHSEVFERMFANKMREQNTNQLIIEDIDAEVFEEFIKFIYFGNTDKLEELTEELLIIADKYQVLYLKEICENLMFIEICDLNAIQLLKTFDKYNCIQMTEKTIDFISKNFLEITKNTPNEWTDLMNNKELLDRITKKMGELIKQRLSGDQTIDDCIKTYTFSYIK